MRFPRIKPDTHCFYHCISRVVDGRFIFALRHGRSGAAEKLIAIMRAEEAFCGVRVLDYVIMAYHFHLVCEVPDPRPLSQSEVLERIGALYGRRLRPGAQEKISPLVPAAQWTRAL